MPRALGTKRKLAAEAAPATALAGGGIRACYPSDHVLQGRLPMRRPGRGVPLLAMLLAVTAWPASTPLAAEGQQQQARGEAAIHNQAQLDDYLRRHVASGEPTQLDAFSDGARERFLSDLVWGSDGLGGFNRGDLAEELDDDQIQDVLGLFGRDMVDYAQRSTTASSGAARTAQHGH